MPFMNVRGRTPVLWGKCDGHRVALCGGGAASGVFCVAGCWLVDYHLTRCSSPEQAGLRSL